MCSHFWQGIILASDHLKNCDKDGRIMLQRILVLVMWIEFSWFRIGSDCRFCVTGTESLGPLIVG
jgi:hypothetical protein